MQGKYDGFATDIYYALKTRLEVVPNIEFHIPRTPWCDVPIFDEHIYVTHGDTNFNPGNPGSSINVRSLEQQANRINAGEIQRNCRPFKLFVTGHVHVGSKVGIAGGYEVITNPALCPKDPYGIAVSGSGQASGQTMWESVRGNTVGDYRIIWVDIQTDRDASLDHIIQPFTDF
jgi:hypothetical protein